MKFAIKNGIIYSDYAVYYGKTILINAGVIEEIVDDNDIPEDYEWIDASGLHICPGLIDLQLYGDGQDLYSEALTVESLARITTGLLNKGTTAYMLTLATNTFEVFREAIAVAQGYAHPAFLGLHLEGPYLNVQKRGAHPAELIVKPTKEHIAALLADAGSVVKMMTIAPECMDEDVLDYLKRYELLLSAGHSAATFEEATLGFERGIATSTHLFNAMSPLHHREVGIVGAIFNHDTVHASIIADGHHLSFEAVKIAKKQMGERLFLITDAVAACSTGIYQHVLQDGYYTLPDGILSGAAISLFDAIRNCVQSVGIPLDEAIRMATTYPARLLKRKDIGNLDPGSQANLILFSADLEVQQVIYMGQIHKS